MNNNKEVLPSNWVGGVNDLPGLGLTSLRARSSQLEPGDRHQRLDVTRLDTMNRCEVRMRQWIQWSGMLRRPRSSVALRWASVSRRLGVWPPDGPRRAPYTVLAWRQWGAGIGVSGPCRVRPGRVEEHLEGRP